MAMPTWPEPTTVILSPDTGALSASLVIKASLVAIFTENLEHKLKQSCQLDTLENNVLATQVCQYYTG